MAEILNVVPNGDRALEHLKSVLKDGKLTFIIGLDKGMQSGRPSVACVIETEDGQAFLGQTSLRLFLDAADRLKDAHGDPRRDEQKGGSA